MPFLDPDTDLLRMRWEEAFFLHWAVDPDVVASRLPGGVTVDRYDGDAYLGVVGFEMANIRPRGFPVGLSFPELNLRTYVDGPDGPGVYFFSLDAEDRLGVLVARRLYRLPYYRARMDATATADGTRFRSRRTHTGVHSAIFDAVYEPTGTPREVPSDSLAAFLTERYRFYVADADDTLYVGRVDHPPWPLQEATGTIHRNGLFAANDFGPPQEPPLVHYSPGVDVTAGPVRTVDT